jgi:D-alanine-D-alanine ligase
MSASSFGRSTPLRVAVLRGGESAERDVSLASGAAVVDALVSRGHEVITVDPAETLIDTMDWSNIDVAFLALHGRFGEDGETQTRLDELGVRYTGSNAATSRLAFSKSASKERFIQENVATPAYVLIHESDDATRIQQRAMQVGFPLVIKPDAQGSSLGVSYVSASEHLPDALTQCFHYDRFGLLESAIAGTEWTASFLDDEPLPLIRIEHDGPLFDFNAKYEDANTNYTFEFDLPSNVIQAIQACALQACQSLGTTGLVRVDLRLDRFQQPWVLEVNTIPGLTDHSLAPKAAAFAGIDFSELCERMVTSCLESVPVPPRD